MTLKEAVRHTDHISKAKPIPEGFLEDRRSVYWRSGILPKDYSKTTEFVLTPRLSELSRPKTPHKYYTPDRPTPIWDINPAALVTSSTPRLNELARHKTLPPAYKPPRPLVTRVSRRALSACPSPRIRQLATHKNYPSLPIKPQSEWEWCQWTSDIPSKALQATATARLEELATPKTLPKSHQPSKPTQWIISKATLQHMATDRLAKLAQAKQVPGYQKDYNPRAWIVSRAALLAQPSPLIENLAKPIPRKCRQKKA